jgi:hypothetical protein
MKNQKNLQNLLHGKKSDYLPDWKVDLLVENDVVNKKRLKKWQRFDKLF